MELLWFIRGELNVRTLQKHGVRIWDEWADAVVVSSDPSLWRAMARVAHGRGGRVDQLNDVVHAIKTNPDSRRLIVSAWNAAEIGKMALAPCHILFQFYVAEGRLSCQLYQRSADNILPGPAIQYRFLRLANRDGGAGDRLGARGSRAHALRRASLPQPPGAGQGTDVALPLPGTPLTAEYAPGICLPVHIR